MLKQFFSSHLPIALSLSLLIVTTSHAELELDHCSCDDHIPFTTEAILKWQRASDAMIAFAYFSIPLEILYFLTRAHILPFKWILLQFGAFIVLCGLTHALTAFTSSTHPFLLLLLLTVFKFLTALVSFATAITLLTLIPQLLRLKVREDLLRIKARDLDRRVGIMKRQESVRCHVRMLTQEIRKSIDRHTILDTTLVELSDALQLENCAVWMPDEGKGLMTLTHELRRRRSSLKMYGLSIPISDPDVVDVSRAEGAKILAPESVLGSMSGGGLRESGDVAAIRLPLLKAAHFKWGTPEFVKASYALLVLVLPKVECRGWSSNELDSVKVVADQVAVALSHAAVLEESRVMREKLEERKRALLLAQQAALMASEARNSFERVMSNGMRRPVHSVLGLLSVVQQETLDAEQRLVVDTLVKTSSVVSTLISDVMDISTVNREGFSLEMRPFSLHSMVKESATIIKCVCECKGFGFGIEVENGVPDKVLGDEKRIIQVILHMIDNLLSGFSEGFVLFRVLSHNEAEDNQERGWNAWKSSFYGRVKFEIAVKSSQLHVVASSVPLTRRGLHIGLSSSMCKRLVQLMQGNIWTAPKSLGVAESTMTLLLQFQVNPSALLPLADKPLDPISPLSLPKGLRVLLADDDETSRVVTRVLLQKLGCRVTAVSSGVSCLDSFGSSSTPFQLVILDLHLPEIDGFEVAARIRKFRSHFWPPILALVTCDEKGLWERCRQVGFDGFIQKPVVVQELRDELFRVMQRS